MKIAIPKLKAILLYFTENTNARFLGKVKLMKLFYFLDFLHLKTYGSPVTYDDYINLEHGPIPSTIKNLIDSADDDIDNSILADIISVEKSDELNIRRIVPKRRLTERDRQYFSETELDILNKVCRRFGKKILNILKMNLIKRQHGKKQNFLNIYHMKLLRETRIV